MRFLGGFGSPANTTAGLALEVGAAGGVTTNSLVLSGYDVLAVEPNPWAHKALQARFPLALAQGRLELLRVAVRGRGEPSAQTFYADLANPQGSGLGAEDPSRNVVALAPVTATCAQIAWNASRPRRRLDVAVIDAEGRSLVCARNLCNAQGLLPPRFLAVELEPGQWEETLEVLERCGYSGFKLVPQAQFYYAADVVGAAHDRLYGRFGEHLSRAIVGESGAGPVGEDALDWVSGPHWRTLADVRRDLDLLMYNPHFRDLVYRGYQSEVVWRRREWFDVHGRHRDQQ